MSNLDKLQSSKKSLLGEKRELLKKIIDIEFYASLSKENAVGMAELRISVIDEKLQQMKEIDCPFNPELSEFDI